MPLYDSIEAFADSPRILLSVDFFRTPPANVMIEWDGAQCNIPQNHHQPCHEACMEGVLVKLADPRRVWRLTGGAEIRQTGVVKHLLGYEAIWPD